MADRGSSPRAAAAALAAITSCLLLAACGGGSDGSRTSGSTQAETNAAGPSSGHGGSGLSVAVKPTEAEPGQSVKASVVNGTDREFTYGAGYELERRSGAGYAKVDLPDRPVIQIGYVAPAGQTGPPVTVKLPRDLEPGSYRVVIQRNVPGVGDLSGQFEITGR